MEQVIRARIPIQIRNVTNLQNEGTIILPDPTDEDLNSPPMDGTTTIPFCSSYSCHPQNLQQTKRPTAITVKTSILVLNVHSNQRSQQHGFYDQIFTIMKEWHLSVDLISTTNVNISMALHSESAMMNGKDDKEILNTDLSGALKQLRELGTVTLTYNMAILSVVGKRMKHRTGVAGEMFKALGDNNINIEAISQGLSSW